MNQFPRVTIPDADPEAVEALQTLLEEAEAQQQHLRREKKGMARAMVLLGKPVFRGVRKPRRKPTKHQQHMARMKARSARA